MPAYAKVFYLTMLVSGFVALHALVNLIVESRRQRPSERPQGRPQGAMLPFVAAALLILLGFLATLPTRPPFAEGGRLGWGFLIGGVFALLAAWMTMTPTRGYATALCTWATLGVGVTFWRFRGYPDDALVGFAFAACLVGFLAGGYGLWVMGYGEESDPKTQNPKPKTQNLDLLNVYLTATIALVTALLLAEMHFATGASTRAEERLWKVFPLTLPALALVAGVLAQAARRMKPHQAWIGATLGYVAALLVLGGGAWLLTRRTFDTPSLFLPVATGILSALVLSLLTVAAERGYGLSVMGYGDNVDPKTQNPKPKTQNLTLPVAALSVLIALFTYFTCAHFLSGYGAALGALAMLLFFVATESGVQGSGFRVQGSDKGTHPSSFIPYPSSLELASALVVAALFRIFLEAHDLEGVRLSLYTHYIFFGLTVGVVVPWCLREMGAWDAGRGTRDAGHSSLIPHPSSLILSGLLLGFACVALPPVVFVFWGFKAVVGLIAGLFFAQLLSGLPAFAGDSERGRLPLHLLTFSIALVAIQFIHLLVEHEENFTRAVKIRIAEVMLGLVILMLIGQAARVWLINRKTPKSKKT